MKAYLERAKAFDDYMKAETHEFEVGKRHLANIMGIDADSMTQQDIDAAISYLLPSGLTDKKARPMMKHPKDIIPQVKAAQFDMDGRPFHHLFYTMRPNYYQLMHQIAIKYDALKLLEKPNLVKNPAMLAGSVWIKKEVIEKNLKEKLQDSQFEHLTKSLERLASHPLSGKEVDFLMQFRSKLQTQVTHDSIEPLMENEAGLKYMTATGSRKTCVAHVKVTEGTGQVTINNQSMLDALPNVASREQIMFPLLLTDKLNLVDIEATVENGGPTSTAGAIRLALSTSLMSFVSPQVNERLRLAGLLTKDPRRKERRKPGNLKARKKPIWKKR